MNPSAPTIPGDINKSAATFTKNLATYGNVSLGISSSKVGFYGSLPQNQLAALDLETTILLLQDLGLSSSPSNNLVMTPTTGSPGTVIVLVRSDNGGFFDVISANMGGVPMVVVGHTGKTVTLFVMPENIGGIIEIVTSVGTFQTVAEFTVTATGYPTTQEGSVINVNPNGGILQGGSVAMSADKNTLLIGQNTSPFISQVAFFHKVGLAWQQDQVITQLYGSNSPSPEGTPSIGLSADGNTAAIATDSGSTSYLYIFNKNNGTWSLQGYFSTLSRIEQTCISADGNTIACGNDNIQAVIVYNRLNGIWQESAVLTGSGGISNDLGFSISISSDGKTIISGGQTDNSNKGAAWIWNLVNGAWIEASPGKLVDPNSSALNQGTTVGINANGTIAIVGGPNANLFGITVWTLQAGTWTIEQRLTDSNINAIGYGQIGISADGNTIAAVGVDLTNNHKRTPIWYKTNNVWNLVTVLINTPDSLTNTYGSMCLSPDATTLAIGDEGINSDTGGVFIYVE